MLLNWCQHSESSLVSLVVVVINIVFDHRDELFTAAETFAIVTFSLQNSPKSFHRTIVDALGYSGHTLSHAGILQLGMEYPVGVLESAVTIIPNSG